MNKFNYTILDLHGATVLIPAGKVYTRQEKAKAILFDRVPASTFVPAFVWCGVEYFRLENN